MSQINVSGLTFCYEGSFDNIFDNVSFRIDTDWKLGFIGRNGRGKTTLLRLLMGQHEYTGSITSDVTFAYFPCEVEDEQELAFSAAMSLAPGAEEWQLRRELTVLEVEEDALWRPWNTLSPGERTKLQLAAMFLRENVFMLIDEPTNNLDAHGRELVSRWLGGKSGFILVSHDRRFLDGCIDHVLSINRVDIEVQRGNFSSWEENRRLRDEFELRQNEKLKKEIAHLHESARRAAEWSDRAESSKIGDGPVKLEPMKNKRAYLGEKSRKMMARSKQLENRRERAAEEKSALLKNLEKADDLRLQPLRHHAPVLVEARGISLGYAGRTILENVELVVKPGERVVLSGRNGCGKSSLLRLICGQPLEHTGTVRLASGLVISTVEQDTSWLRGDLRAFAEESGIDLTRFLTMLRKLDFKREQFEKDMTALSAGQRKKVLLARSLCQSAHLYVWDEPLNYIDVLSRMQIESMLQDSDCTMLLVEHDSAFCDHIATRRLELEGSRAVR